MVDPVTVLFVIIFGSLTAAAFWNHIVSFMMDTLIPFVRSRLGDRLANLFVDLTVFLDKRACPTHEAFARMWNAFRWHVLGLRVRYVKKDATQVGVTTEATVRTNDGKCVKQTTVEEIPWSQVPDDIREQMMKTMSNAECDAVDVIRRRAQERGMTLENW